VGGCSGREDQPPAGLHGRNAERMHVKTTNINNITLKANGGPAISEWEEPLIQRRHTGTERSVRIPATSSSFLITLSGACGHIMHEVRGQHRGGDEAWYAHTDTNARPVSIHSFKVNDLYCIHIYICI